MKSGFFKLLGKINSRKFYVEIVATVALFMGKITGKEWILVSCIYIGGNVLKYLVELLTSYVKKREE
jgi:hypothetical protein